MKEEATIVGCDLMLGGGGACPGWVTLCRLRRGAGAETCAGAEA